MARIRRAHILLWHGTWRELHTTPSKVCFHDSRVIVAIVFGEFYRGMGWIGALIFIIEASMGALGMYLLHVSLEGFEKLSENDVGVCPAPCAGNSPSRWERKG